MAAGSHSTCLMVAAEPMCSSSPSHRRPRSSSIPVTSTSGACGSARPSRRSITRSVPPAMIVAPGMSARIVMASLTDRGR